jgi:uncharacterized protein (DUF983 family)
MVPLPGRAVSPAGRTESAVMPHTPDATTILTDADDRPLRPALLRGWHRRCPNCGAGPMMRGYLTVRDACPVCGEALHHQRADDGPAYLTILIVGHLVAPALIFAYSNYDPDPLFIAVLFSVLTSALSLYLLPRLKGGLVALQWAKRMHGFGSGPRV